MEPTLMAAGITAAASVASAMLASRNQQKTPIAAPSLGNAAQMQPQVSAFQDLSPTAPSANPAFGQFLGG